LDRMAAEARAHVWSPATWRTKASQWKRYIVFCTWLGVRVLPTDSLTMSRYIMFLSDCLKFSTIDNYVSGVISLNSYFGYDIQHIRRDFAFSAALRGLRRMLGDPTPIRVTVTVTDLLNMYSLVNFKDYNECVMWCCLVTSFRSLLRKSNLVPTSSNDTTGHYMRRGSVKFYPWGMMLRISSSKTIQFGQREHLVPITYTADSPLCAASLMKRHLSDAPAGPDSPLFLVRRGSRLVPLSYPPLLKFLKRLIVGIGMNPERAGVHSMRRAGAAFFHQSGIPLEDIRQVGDWASLTALIYLAKPMSARIEMDYKITTAIRAAHSSQ